MKKKIAMLAKAKLLAAKKRKALVLKLKPVNVGKAVEAIQKKMDKDNAAYDKSKSLGNDLKPKQKKDETEEQVKHKERAATRKVTMAIAKANALKAKLKKKEMRISLQPLKGYEPNCFGLLDKNGNGSISRKEMNLRVLKACLTEQKRMIKCFIVADSDKNGVIKPGGFDKFQNKCLEPVCFKYADKNNNKHVDEAEKKDYRACVIKIGWRDKSKARLTY